MDRKWRRCLVSLALAALVPAAVPRVVPAQTYPSKPVRVLVGFPAGGVADIFARVVGQKLAEGWGQPVVVENRPGAGSNIAAEAAAKAPADGYTLFIYSTVNAVNMTLYSRPSYDLVKDFAPVSLVGSMGNVLVVHPSLAAGSVKELIALARAKPGHLHFASAGSGTTQHLSAQLFKSMAGIDIVHVPYKGSVPAMTALLSGEIPFMFNVMSTALPQVKAGKVRALAVTSARRSPLLPEVPTVAEAGLPGFEAVSHFGVLAPAAAPGEIVAKLSGEIARVLQMPDVRERLLNNGAEPMSSTPEQYAAFLKEEVAKWGKVVKESGARVD